MDLTVCPHVHYYYDSSATACKNYVVNVSFTDTKLAVTAIKVTHADLSTSEVKGTGSDISVSNGDTVTFEMEKDPVTSLVDINISLGGESYFPQTKESVTEADTTGTMVVKIQGQGLSLPVKMKMSGSEFDMEYKITFKTPIVTVTKLFPTLTGTTRTLVTALDNVPTSSEVVDGSVSPASFLRLSVRKVGAATQATPGFCQSQSFGSGWTALSCDLEIAPISADNLVIEIEMYNWTSTLWQLASDFYQTGMIDYRVPTVDSLYTLDANGNKVGTGAVNTETVMLSDPYFYISGTSFASLGTMSLTYVNVTEYKLWLQGVNPELSLCSKIEYQSENVLKCQITSCLDAREIPADPSVVLQIGELRSAEKAGILTLPQPAISSISPTLILDAGYAEIEIFGNSFSEYLAPNGDFQEACTAWQAKLNDLTATQQTRRLDTGSDDTSGALQPYFMPSGGRQLTSADTLPAMQMLGSVTVTVGDATCSVTAENQNNTYVKCQMTKARRASRAEPEAGELRGKIISQVVDVNVILKVGSIEEANKPTLSTQLAQCAQEGYYRISEDDDTCDQCPKGTYSTSFTDEWPLGCTFCASTSYQDEIGQTVCKVCPDNTESVPPATSLEDCRCKKGYYSPVYDATQMYGMPGFACLECSSADFTLDTSLDEAPCSLDNLGDLCDEPVAHHCVRVPAGSFNFRLCTVYCPGGTMLPLAKPFFYISKHSEVAATAKPGQTEYQPVVETCLPLYACLNANQCSAGYEGLNCGLCVFGYFPDPNSDDCLQCGEEQQVGTLIMAGMGMMGTFGAFFLSLLYLKMLSDPIFKGQIKLYVARRIVDRIKALAGVGGGGAQQKNPLVKLADKLRFKRVTLVIRKWDVSGYWHYFKNRDLGFVFRVDRDHAVHVAGVRPGSPASRMGISHSWRLLVINGKHVKADIEQDVQDQLANTKLPIYCLFRAPRTEKDDEEAEIDSSDAKELSASGMRLITMSLGIMQSFNGIQRIDIEWPELFTKVMEILANFTFNFNFFQPDCSVSSPYWYTWLGFTVAPYAMMAPITFSYLVVRWLSFRESRGDPQYRDVQSWLLLNAWGRAMLTILLLFIQMHMTKLSSPFQCYTLKDGSAVMVDSQDIYCDLADDQYFLIFTVACFFLVIFAAGFATLNVCLYWSYHWQAGTKTRDRACAESLKQTG